MMSYDQLYPEIARYWDLDRLYDDLNLIQRSDLQKAIFRGIISGDSIKKIAEKLNWQPNSLSVEVNRQNIYGDLLILLEKDTMSRTKLPRWLEEKGYKKKFINLSIVSREPSIKSQEIIAALRNNLVQGTNLSWSEAEIEKKIIQGDQAVKEKNWLNAIETYWLVLRADFNYLGCLLKIATIYDQIKAFKDSVAICQFALEYIQDQTDDDRKKRSIIYNLLGGAYEELCLKSMQNEDLQLCICHYTQALIYEEKELFPAWNIFSAYVSFHEKNKKTSQQDTDQEKLAFNKFSQIANTYYSSEILQQRDYRTIREDAASVIEKIKDENLKNAVRIFFNSRF